MHVSWAVGVPTAVLGMLLGGCESVPGGSSSAPTAIKVVELLDPYFLRFDGERMPIDEFLFRMREVGREAAKTKRAVFGIRILAPEDMWLVVQRIVEDLQVSGIRHVWMG